MRDAALVLRADPLPGLPQAASSALIVLPWPWTLREPPDAPRPTLEGWRDMGEVSVVAEVAMWRGEFERASEELVTVKRELARLREAAAQK